MAKTFKCPNCGGPLEYLGNGELTVRCPFCANTVIVPEELRPENKPAEEAPPRELPPQPPDRPATLLGQLIHMRRVARGERRAVRRQWWNNCRG
jgi:uncharacterized Zn finger protein (UPF0148 family)